MMTWKWHVCRQTSKRLSLFTLHLTQRRKQYIPATEDTVFTALLREDTRDSGAVIYINLVVDGKRCALSYLSELKWQDIHWNEWFFCCNNTWHYVENYDYDKINELVKVIRLHVGEHFERLNNYAKEHLSWVYKAVVTIPANVTDPSANLY